MTFDSLEETQDSPPKLLGEPITGNPLTEEELAALYPLQTQIEKVGGQTYSFSRKITITLFFKKKKLPWKERMATFY